MNNNEALLQKIYAHPSMRKIPVGYYSTVAEVVMDILADMRKKPTSKALSSKGGGENDGE